MTLRGKAAEAKSRGKGALWDPMATRKRKLNATQRPLFARQDAWLLLELPALAAIAVLVSERHWAIACYYLERAKARIGAFTPEPIQRGIARMNQGAAEDRDAFRIAATRSEHHIQLLREFFCRRSSPTRLTGAENITEGLSTGRGVILWIAHFSFNGLSSKQALHHAGFDVWHLSRPEHGFSKSRFGIAFLNPIRVKSEMRYLGGRIIIDRSRPSAAVRDARKRLESNQIISITAGAWEGSTVADVEIGNGCFELSTGAPGLAYVTGATLLPVFTVRNHDEAWIRVIVDDPIVMDRQVTRGESLAIAAQDFADRLKPFVATHPSQWRDWQKLR